MIMGLIRTRTVVNDGDRRHFCNVPLLLRLFLFLLVALHFLSVNTSDIQERRVIIVLQVLHTVLQTVYIPYPSIGTHLGLGSGKICTLTLHTGSVLRPTIGGYCKRRYADAFTSIMFSPDIFSTIVITQNSYRTSNFLVCTYSQVIYPKAMKYDLSASFSGQKTCKN